MAAIGPVDYVYFWTADMDRAVSFYERVLGLRLVRQDRSQWAEFDAGPLRLALHAAVEDRAPEPGGTVVFRVDDLDAARADLEVRGAEFEEHAGEIEGFARFASLRDPDGNRVDLIEYRRGGE
jgi:catechol 2,3-dioxygenase-like lactoylglutathione lyase family enzyme